MWYQESGSRDSDTNLKSSKTSSGQILLKIIFTLCRVCGDNIAWYHIIIIIIIIIVAIAHTATSMMYLKIVIIRIRYLLAYLARCDVLIYNSRVRTRTTCVPLLVDHVLIARRSRRACIIIRPWKTSVNKSPGTWPRINIRMTIRRSGGSRIMG